MKYNKNFKTALLTILLFTVLFFESYAAETLDNNIKVSVIVPVYNTSDYLKDCLNSVTGQSLKNIEIICVNDGSTDKSAEILKEYAENDSRIKVITQINKGASAARNTGLNVAAGEYIAFIDSDDKIDSDAYETSYQKAKEKSADILMFGEKSFSVKAETYLDGFNSLDTPGAMMLWNKIYKRSFLLENDFHLLESAKCYNDECFNSVVLPKALRVVYIPDRFYSYRKNRTGSIQTSANAKLKAENTLIYANYVCGNWRKNGYIKEHGSWLLKKLILMINRSIQELESKVRHYYADALMKITATDIYNEENISKLRNFEKTLLSNWILNV